MFRPSAIAFLLVLGCSIALRGPVAAAAGASANAAPDSVTAAYVRQKLLALGGASGGTIAVEVRDGIVRLSGTATSLLGQRQSPVLAKTVRGVRGVVDLVKLASVRRSDADIQADVQASLSINPATAGWLIQAAAIGGTVTLSGTVSSTAERSLAGILARGVEGVVDVDNEIVVGHAATRPPAEIKVDVDESLSWDPWLADRSVAVHVTPGQVVLSGTVASAYERARAIDLAHVSGVTSVIDRLRVDPSLATEENLTPHPSDARIAAAIDVAFHDDPRLAAAVGRLHVAVAEGGIAFLSGTVADDAARRAARHDARNAVGVRRVVDGITVKLRSPPADAVVQRGVETALLHNPYIALDDISVTVDHGRVRLRGVVPSAHLVRRAAQIASHVPGVTDVADQLTALRRQAQPTPPQILAGLQQSLRQMPDAAVQAALNDGVVTLTGIVHSVPAAERAEALAYANGAATVDDRLRVEPHAAPA